MQSVAWTQPSPRYPIPQNASWQRFTLTRLLRNDGWAAAETLEQCIRSALSKKHSPEFRLETLCSQAPGRETGPGSAAAGAASCPTAKFCFFIIRAKKPFRLLLLHAKLINDK